MSAVEAGEVGVHKMMQKSGALLEVNIAPDCLELSLIISVRCVQLFDYPKRRSPYHTVK